jgi:hypothetical protein
MIVRVSTRIVVSSINYSTRPEIAVIGIRKTAWPLEKTRKIERVSAQSIFL